MRGLQIPPWEQRKSVAVWRGALTNPIRERVMDWTRNRSDVDFHTAEYPQGSFLTVEEQAQFKVILDMDGFSYSKRLHWQWGVTGSAILRTGIYDDVLLRQAEAGVHYARFEASSKQSFDTESWHSLHLFDITPSLS